MNASNKPAISIRTYRPGDAGYVAYRHGVLYARDYGFDHVFEKYVLQSLSKFLDEPFKGHARLVKRKEGGVGNGILRRLPDPFDARLPALPFRGKLGE